MSPAWFFDTSGFVPRWDCGDWSPALGWTHIIADLATWGAYTAIPLVIAYFLSRRKDVPFPRILILFGAFIFACGATHLVEAAIFWTPVYRLSAAVKVATAIVSCATVIALIPTVPVALAFRSPKQLREEIAAQTRSLVEINARLAEEVERRDAAEARMREAIRQREESLALLDSLQTSSPIGIAFFDTDLRFARVNEAMARLNGRTQQEHEGRTLREVAPWFADQVEPILQGVLDSRQPALGVEIKGSPENGHRSRLANYYPVVTDRGRLLGVGAVTLDDTDRRRHEAERLALQEKIQQGQKLESLGVLAGGIAHDFNNLLTGIMGNADLALAQLPSHTAAHRYVVNVINGAVRAAELCKQMLAYAGKGRFLVTRFDMNALVQEMTHLLRAAVSKKIDLVFDLKKDLSFVEGDVTQVRQVVMNLITNAADAIGEEAGTVTIRTGELDVDRNYLRTVMGVEEDAEGHYVFLEVQDTGIGMSPDTQKRIFDPFFTTKFAGRGLGLAAALGIIRGHGGFMKVYSQLGQGSNFKFLLPARLRIGPPAPEDCDSPPAPAMTGGLVLVIDDEEAVRDVVASMLTARKYEVICAADGEEGLALFRDHRHEIQVVLLDLNMPKMGGDATLTEILRIDPDARVVMTSGYNEQDTVQHFAGRGLAGFLQKPFVTKELLAKIQGIIESKAKAAGS